MHIISKGPLVLVTDSYLRYAHLVDKSTEVRMGVEHIVGGMWVAGQMSPGG